jgi:MFS family permease
MTEPLTSAGGERAWRRLPAGVWQLGFVSLLMDVSSEMIHALLPVYLVAVLGASTLTVGFIEGIAEATASITKIFSGALSDWLGRRKLLAAIGYGLAAFTKPVFPLATSIGWVVAARFIDRIGKGIRGAPRDALVADIAPPGLRGAAFGLRQSLDTAGAFIGPALAIALMWLTANHIRAVFWAAVLPGLAAFALIAFVVREPAERPAALRGAGLHWRRELGRLPARYWWIVGVSAVFTLARFSEAFLVLRAKELGLGLAWVPAVLVAMNIAYAVTAYPVGVLADRMRRAALLPPGLALLIAADLCLAFAGGLPGLAAGIVLWGLHMGVTQGLLSTLVADVAPANLRGTAFGVFNLVAGLAVLAASVIAGGLWSAYGSRATFLVGAGFAALTLAILLPLLRRDGHRQAG